MRHAPLTSQPGPPGESRKVNVRTSRTRGAAVIVGGALGFVATFGGLSLARHISEEPDCTASHPEWSVARAWDEATLDAIRRDVPNPPVHARNLFHVSAAMWDAWAAYDPQARGYFLDEKHDAADVAAARDEAISTTAAASSDMDRRDMACPPRREW